MGVPTYGALKVLNSELLSKLRTSKLKLAKQEILLKEETRISSHLIEQISHLRRSTEELLSRPKYVTKRVSNFSLVYLHNKVKAAPRCRKSSDPCQISQQWPCDKSHSWFLIITSPSPQQSTVSITSPHSRALLLLPLLSWQLYFHFSENLERKKLMLHLPPLQRKNFFSLSCKDWKSWI